MHVYCIVYVCTMHTYMFLDHYAFVNDALMYDVYIDDPWDLTMLHVCVMHISMMRQFCHGRTEGRTNGDPDTRVLCMMHVFMMWHICHACTNLDSDAYIHYACMYYAYTYAPWSCMHDAYIYAPWSLYICQLCINVWCIHLWSLKLD